MNDDHITRHEFEGSIKQIWDGIKSLGETIKSESEARRNDYRMLSSKLDKLGNDFSKSREFRVAPVMSVAAVAVAIIIAIVGGIGSGYIRDQDRLAMEIERMDIRNADTHVKLDESLQREMKLLDASGDSKIDALDNKLQLEISAVRDVLKAALLDTTDDIAQIRQWIVRHDEQYPPQWLIDKVNNISDRLMFLERNLASEDIAYLKAEFNMLKECIFSTNNKRDD